MEGGLDKKNVISSDLTLIVLLYVRMNLFLVTAQCSLKGFLVVHVYFFHWFQCCSSNSDTRHKRTLYV